MPDVPPIVYAVMAGDYFLVKERIKAGGDINLVDPVRSTALSLAVHCRNLAMIRLLLNHGADPAVKDCDGKDSFDYIRTYEAAEALGALADPRFRHLTPRAAKPSKPTRLPTFFSPLDFDPRGERYNEQPQEIVGVTGHQSHGAWVVGDDYKVAQNRLIAWRDAKGVLHCQELLLLKAILPDERFQIPDQQLVRLTVIMNHDRTRAAVVDSFTVDVRDEELAHLLADYLKPKTFTHPVIGTLTLDRKYSWYQGGILLGKHEVDLRIDGEPNSVAIREAVKLVTEPAPILAKLRHLFATDILALKNSSWLDEGEAELTPADLGDEPLPTIVSISPDGDLEFWCGGSDLFWGHSVVLRHCQGDDSWSFDLVG